MAVPECGVFSSTGELTTFAPRRDPNGLIEREAHFVAAHRPDRRPSLTLVASTSPEGAVVDRRAAGDAQDADGRPDWSSLMASAQDGDREAYRALLEGVTPYLRSLAARCFRDARDVEDAVQDVLLTVHVVRHAYDPGRPFGPWLLAIANRRMIDRLRRQTRAKLRDIALAAEHVTFSGGQANLPPRIEETSLDEAALREAIEHLPPDQRQAIKLLKLKEMSLKEAALTSGRSVAALKVATHRAIANLRKLLQKPGETP
jgi:RNA polymerase sigma-70 factor (ECF subfamily)